MNQHDSNIERERILDAALELAEREGWEPLRLHEVARSLGIGLEGIRRHFREKEELVDAWFDRADAAMLRESEEPGFHELPVRRRLERLLLAWLDALAPHRRVTRQMILNQLEPGHLHMQIAGLWRISRTVQWWREAAGIRHAWLRRAVEESALTAIYLSVFLTWLCDESPGYRRSRRALERLLDLGERLASRCGPATGSGGESMAAPAP
ncbi:MAG: TetR/AcrR family transcriptional regulator [Gammaproteobacteria bacterium]|nr:MAG: TetR/AcrR family transcriptional regulator [Gammaproteobacteria bacterium]